MKNIPLLMATSLTALVLAACSPPEGEGAAQAPAQPPAQDAAPAVDDGVAAGNVKPALPTPTLLDAAATAEPIVVAGKCNMESSDGRAFSAEPLVIENKGHTKVTGWLLANEQGAAPSEPVLRIESSDKSQVWQLPLQLSISREDLVASGSTPGFDAALDAAAIPAGRYHLYLAFRSEAGLMACDNGRHIELQ